MNRRDALRVLAAGVAVPMMPHSLLAALREARAVVGSVPASSTLSPHQDATVSALAEMILPRTETPGATDVGASKFIDLLLTEWYDEPERTLFLKGLDDVDAHSQSLFAKEFIACSPTQQAEILAWLGEQMTEDLENRKNPPVRRRRAAREPSDNFYLMFRNLTLTAYFTSEAGATQELHFEIIPDHRDACAELPPATGGPAQQ